MKTQILFLFFFMSYLSFGQTSVISIKSRSGDLAEIPDSPDKYGAVAPRRVYDTLIKIEGNCVVQIGHGGWAEARFQDTVCEHWYYEQNNYDPEKINEYHGSDVVLIGFDERSEIDMRYRPFRRKSNKLSMKWLIILLGIAGLGTYVGLPVGRHKK